MTVMSALAMALLLAGDFWGKVAQTPYDSLLADGARLRSQAERSCLPPISCREGSPAFLVQQALLRQAAAAFQHAAALRPEDSDAPFFAAGSLREAHDYEAAAAQYEEARRRHALGPRELDICFDLGTTWANLGRFQRSIDEYMRALRLTHEPHDRAGLLINAAESTMALGRLRESIDLYRRGVEAGEQALHAGTVGADEQAVHLLGLAVALDRDEQVDKGAQMVARALELDAGAQRLHGHSNFFVPAGDVAYYDALVALAKGDRAAAATAFQRFLQDVPQSPFGSRARTHLTELGAHAPPPPNLNRIAHVGVIAAKGPRTALEINSSMKDFLNGPCVPAQSGTYTLEGTISEEGRVMRLRLSPADARALSCLEEATRGWHFHTGEKGKTTFTLRLLVKE
jgi:tetratricopeptide (TPR) repeat protein